MLTLTQVAKRLGVSTPTVKRLIKTGALAAHRISNVYRVPEEDLADYLRRTRIPATTQAAEGGHPSAAGGNAP